MEGCRKIIFLFPLYDSKLNSKAPSKNVNSLENYMKNAPAGVSFCDCQMADDNPKNPLSLNIMRHKRFCYSALLGCSHRMIPVKPRPDVPRPLNEDFVLLRNGIPDVNFWISAA